MWITDDADMEEVYNTERHLLHVVHPRPRSAHGFRGPVSDFWMT